MKRTVKRITVSKDLAFYKNRVNALTHDVEYFQKKSDANYHAYQDVSSRLGRLDGEFRVVAQLREKERQNENLWLRRLIEKMTTGTILSNADNTTEEVSQGEPCIEIKGPFMIRA